MKFFMAFMFSIIPALVIAVPMWFILGPFALLLGWAVFGFGMDVCLNSEDQKQ